jgi:signal transduction histidine kinase/ActR/RegA family two-component response regulator
VAQGGVKRGTVYLRDRTEPVARRLSRYIAPGFLVLMASLMFAVMSLDARALRLANRDLEAQIEEREKVEAALRQSQKMEAIGRLTGGIAHDFNNMLGIVMGNLDLLLRRFSDGDPKLVRLAEHAMEGAKRAAALTQRLLAFSRLQPLRPTDADIAKTVTDMTHLLRRTLGETVAVETVSAGGLWRAHIDLPQLETAIVNLAINSRDAMPNGGKLTIETGNAYLDRAYAEADEDVKPGQYVMVAITDTGVGIPANVLGQVFEPFFTTKPTGMGTGLGLSQVQGFIKQSGGHIRIYSEVGVGTTVKLYLPRSQTDLDRPVAGALRSEAPGRRDLTVLVVEDEIGVREFAVEALGELGYDVISADGAKAALEQLGAHPEVALMLTDVVMPETNGRVLAEEARRRWPKLRVVFMTGYTRNAIVHNGVVDAGAHLVSKPFSVAQLGAELAAALAEPVPS